MKKPSKNSSKKISNETKLKYAIDFIEELSWLLEAKQKLNLNEIPDILRNKLLLSNDVSSIADKYASPNPNIHYLIGVLPRLFQDKKLFSKNEDIASFANEVLGIEINRIEKRSKYELIGLIACEANELDDNQLKDLVSSLSIITGNNDKLTQMAKEKQSTGFSWNETIRRLAD